MPELTISQVARQIGLQASAIRYYDSIGLLPRAPRMNGQRRYDTTALYRLAIIQHARRLGFSLSEIRFLFFGFRNITRASERWRTLSQRKLAELDRLIDRQRNCHRSARDHPGHYDRGAEFTHRARESEHRSSDHAAKRKGKANRAKDSPFPRA